MSIYELVLGETLPDLGLLVSVERVLLTGLDTGHTFALAVRDPDDTATLFTKTTGFTGQAGSLTTTPRTPNVVCQWATSGETALLVAGRDHKAILTITRTADGRKRKYPFVLRVAEDPTL